MTLPGEWIDPSPPADLAAGLLRSVLSPRFLFEITCGLYAPAWQLLAGGPAYSCLLGDGTGAYNDSVDEITGVTVNGTALTAAASVADCKATASSFFWDGQATQTVVVHLAGDANPQARGTTVMLTAMLRVSDGPSDAGGYRWRPWLANTPALTRQIYADFSSITQIGGGSIVLQNETHYFDSRIGRNWDFGTVKVIMTLSGMDWAKRKTLATFIPSSPKFGVSTFVLNLQDRRVLIDTFYPKTLYDTVAYPNIDPQAVGKVIPLGFGKILGIEPVCVDTSTLEFMVAGHPIKSFDGVRVLDQASGLWNPITFKSVDEPTARFRLDGADWAVGKSLVVDFSGWVRDDGSLLDNPAEIAQAMLVDQGLPVDAAGFEAARLWYDKGYTGDGVIQTRVTSRAPSVYLDTQAKALATLQQIMVNVRAYLTTNEDGEFTMIPFRNYQVSALPTVDLTRILGPGLVADGSGTSNFRVQAGSKLSAMTVFFGTRAKESIQQVITYNSEFNSFSRALQTDSVETFQSLFTSADDAAYLAQALVNEYRVDPLFYTLDLKWLPFTWQPGAQHLHVIDQRHGIDVVLEIIKITMNISKRSVSLQLGNLRGFDQSSGFWVLSTDTTPAGNPLDWPQSGQKAAPYETQYRRQQAGHWAGSDDFAVDTAVGGNTWTALDQAPSRFQ